ncbi:hypothetical protein TOTORO_00670 [Serratia phage vB_SmaS-Totoro]|nr:hypothetical protein TOTORO_00670 [Serratia phage vB_SmaS-Totoro]
MRFTKPSKRVLVLGDVPIFFRVYANAYRLDINDVANGILQGIAYLLSNDWDTESDRDENFSMAVQDFLYWEYEASALSEGEMQTIVDRWEEIVHCTLVNNRLPALINTAKANGLDEVSCRDRFKAKVSGGRLEIEFLR